MLALCLERELRRGYRPHAARQVRQVLSDFYGRRLLRIERRGALDFCGLDVRRLRLADRRLVPLQVLETHPRDGRERGQEAGRTVLPCSM